MSSRIKNALERLDSHLPAWARRMVRNREWRLSSACSVAIWMLATFVIYKLASMFGHGWMWNIAVALTIDAGVFLISRLIWKKRTVTLSTSASKWTVVAASFFAINCFLAWLLMGKMGISTLPARGILAMYGIAMNPVIFQIRDKAIFANWRIGIAVRPLCFKLNGAVIFPRPKTESA